MKNRFSVVLIVLSLLVALVGVAAAPKAPGAVTLIGAGYVEGKGVVFTFHITGKVSKSDMKGGVTVDGGGNYGLDCVKVDSETVKCTAPKGVAGHDVTVTWGGSTFWTHVAGIPDPKFCYSVYDYDRYDVWQDYGPHCQDEPAQYVDMITYYNPDWDDEYNYWFLPEGPECSGISGDAFYYWGCPVVEEEN